MLAQLSPEALASIVFGILQLSIGLIALWQQRQHSRLHRLWRAKACEVQLTLIRDRPPIERTLNKIRGVFVVRGLHYWTFVRCW